MFEANLQHNNDNHEKHESNDNWLVHGKMDEKSIATTMANPHEQIIDIANNNHKK